MNKTFYQILKIIKRRSKSLVRLFDFFDGEEKGVGWLVLMTAQQMHPYLCNNLVYIPRYLLCTYYGEEVSGFIKYHYCINVYSFCQNHSSLLG